MIWNSERPNSEERERWEGVKRGRKAWVVRRLLAQSPYKTEKQQTLVVQHVLCEKVKKGRKANSEREGRNENGLMFTFVFQCRDISVSMGKEETTLRKLETTRNSLTRRNNYGSISRLEATALKIVQLRALVVYFCFRTGTRAIKWIRKNRKRVQSCLRLTLLHFWHQPILSNDGFTLPPKVPLWPTFTAMREKPAMGRSRPLNKTLCNFHSKHIVTKKKRKKKKTKWVILFNAHEIVAHTSLHWSSYWLFGMRFCIQLPQCDIYISIYSFQPYWPSIPLLPDYLAHFFQFTCAWLSRNV